MNMKKITRLLPGLSLSFSVVLFALHSGLVNAQSVEEIMAEINAVSPSLNNAGETYRGQLRPVNFTQISSGLDAKLNSFPVRAGNRIEQGEVIAEFNCAIEQANNTIELAREESAARSVEINERLRQLNNLSELELAQSRSELDIARAEVERTTSILSECVIRAPFSGTVTEKYVEAYQYVSQGEVLIELIDTRNLEIEMVLPSLNLRRYQVGRQFEFLIDETDQTVNAVIDRVVNVIDPVSQTVRVIGTLIQPPGNLMPGMSGVVFFPE
ncbi:MAG: hypothetical protein COA71_10115 [SAR86 cluster bacterium]|uniref:Uncharacterized protein n=1 Tax=SAR86 cluster bacterium TaxID=2030880 RepID=A0A2A5CAQ5_9GAMM|nr:MAG: hypothetical protein COA71_10115 [SAR86 cluster bacterium]